MTTPQRTLYFRLWGQAQKANWTSSKGLCTMRPGRQNPWTDLVHPETLTEPQTADTLRHRCHFVACGKDVSSKDATNKQLDRIFTLFRLLADPDDLDAVLAWDHPEASARKRLEHGLKKFEVGYIYRVMVDKFGRGDIADLTEDQLKQLLRTLHHRPKALKPEHRPTPQAVESAPAAAGSPIPAVIMGGQPCGPREPISNAGSGPREAQWRPGQATPFARRKAVQP